MYTLTGNKEHYADPLEIMAYACSIVAELRFDYSTEEILQIINNKTSGACEILDKYIEIFSISNKDKKVLNRLYKYMYEYLDID